MKKIICLITFAVLLYVGSLNFSTVLKYVVAFWGLLAPFILGGAIAFILNVPMKWIEGHVFGKGKKKGNKAAVKLTRPLSLILAILFVAVILLIVGLVVAPEVGATAVSVVKSIERNLPAAEAWLIETFKGNQQILEWINAIEIQPQKILDSVGNLLKNGVDNVLSSTISVTMGVVSTVTNFGIGFIFAIYLLLQKEKLTVQLKKAMYAIFPEKVVHHIVHICSLANKTFANFIAGQCIEAVILGTMFFVVMSILRFPYALLVGVLIGFTALIPVFGAFIGCAVGFVLILLADPMKALLFLVVFLVLQQLEGNLIYPHVVGNSVGLPSIWVLVAVSLGGSLMGVVGMLIFIPLISVLYTLFREWTYDKLRQKKIKV